MIQRIQSLFLLAAGACSIFLIFYPISRMVFGDDIFANFFSYGFKNASWPYEKFMSTYPVLIITSVSGLLSLITIFLYRNRILQMRLCVYNILITLGLIIIIFYYYFAVKRGALGKELALERHHFSFAVMLPFVNVILLFQAFRAIRRDDLMVKSYDRLR
jgi:hypothetical protein